MACGCRSRNGHEVSDLRDWTRDAASWLPEFQTAIEAIGRGLQGRQPTPELLASFRDDYVDAIPKHKIAVESRRKTSRTTVRHLLSISGSRIDASWELTNRQLFEAVNAVCPELPNRLS
jgi:hypothetical protein